jgi:hypothetical protein
MRCAYTILAHPMSLMLHMYICSIRCPLLSFARAKNAQVNSTLQPLCTNTALPTLTSLIVSARCQMGKNFLDRLAAPACNRNSVAYVKSAKLQVLCQAHEWKISSFYLSLCVPFSFSRDMYTHKQLHLF